VVVPLGATTPRPTLLAWLPEPERCRALGSLVQDRAFVLCPALAPTRGVDEARAVMRASLASLKARFGRHVASGGVVFVALGEAADLGTWLVRQEPSFFPHVLFVEGGLGWSSTDATVFYRAGGQRLVFACRSEACRSRAASAVALTMRAGAEARMAALPADSELLGERSVLALRPSFEWLHAGDARWPRRREAPVRAPAAPDAGGGPSPLPLAAALPPLAADAPLMALEVPKHASAIVSVPQGAASPRPVLVALHGNYDRPEWQCQVWRAVTDSYPFVLCPRGLPRADAPKSEDRYTYGALALTTAELEAGLSALEARFGQHVRPGPKVLVGFSLGAIHAAKLMVAEPAVYPRGLLIEGGEAWSAQSARRYREGGGERVLFACGQETCRQRAKQAVALLERAGVSARVASGGKAGHTYDGAVQDAVAAEWTWLTSGASGWGPGP
jgi:predicted esterase